MHRSNYIIVLLFFLLLGSFAAYTDNAHAMQNLSAERLKELMDSGTPIFLLNPLSEIEFNEAHIPGSTNIPLSQIRKTKKLPRDKNTLIVTYCKGPKWVVYKQAASLVVNRLYKNVATFKGGLPEWKKAGYPLNTQRSLPKYTIPSIDGKQFKTMVGQACIVDIRVPKLYGEGHLKEKIGIEKADALSPDYLKKYFLKIPLDKLSDQFPKIPKDRTVVVLDYRGKQALVAARFLKHHGYGEVCLVKGGLSAVSK